MIGDKIKVRLPGETPWAIVTAELPDGRIMARIDNHPVGELHGYKYGDVVTFEPYRDYSRRVSWILSPIEQQMPNGPQGKQTAYERAVAAKLSEKQKKQRAMPPIKVGQLLLREWCGKAAGFGVVLDVMAAARLVELVEAVVKAERSNQ
jgi:hypothetical protein